MRYCSICRAMMLVVVSATFWSTSPMLAPESRLRSISPPMISPSGEYGGDELRGVGFGVVVACDGDHPRSGGEVEHGHLPALKDVLHLGAEGLFDQFALGAARGGDDRVAVADTGDVPQGAIERIRVVLGDVGDLADGRILFQHHFPVVVRVDLQRGRLPLCEACGGSPWGSPRAPVRRSCARCLSLS